MHMPMNTQRLTSILMLLVLASTASSAELVREFKGRNSTTTGSFSVDGPWLLDWRLDSDYEDFIALDVTLIDARTGQHVGRVMHTKRKGNGLKLFTEPGTYQLRISSSMARWTIKIQSIDEEELERYTPKRKPTTPGFISSP